MTHLKITELAEPGDTARLSLTGELDAATRERLAAAAYEAIAAGRASVILIDLDNLTFLDAAGVATLLAAQSIATAHGVNLRVVNPRGIVRYVLRVTGAYHQLDDREATIR